jgi:uncharacterized protein (TIGR01777 family)
MHSLITGGTGFIGTALVPALRSASWDVTILSRDSHDDSDGVRYVTSLDALQEPVDAVINLAGASLAAKRWNDAYKRKLRDSRLDTTAALGAHFTARGESPAVWLNASAIGYYGPRGDEVVDEDTASGHGFAAELCRDWEQAARDAAPDGTRLCLLRLGVVMDAGGGAYPQMAAPFRMGIANWVGDGQQYLSWVHRADVVAAMLFLLQHGEARGAFNVTAPEPVTSRGLCEVMETKHRRILRMPMPAPVMRLMVGEMADELLINGQRVLPKALGALGFEFRYRDLRSALDEIEGGR